MGVFPYGMAFAIRSVREGDARQPFGKCPQARRQSGLARGGGPADQSGVAAQFEDTVRACVRRSGQVGARRVQTRQGLRGPAVLITTGMSGDRPVGALVSGTIETLVDGLRPR
jgi:hypothetical protein